MGISHRPRAHQNLTQAKKPFDHYINALITTSESQAASIQATGTNAQGFWLRYEQQMDLPQNAFSAQFDMTPQQGTGHRPVQGFYNMSAMANTLLQQHTFRNNSNNGGQARYIPNNTSSGAMPSVTQYPGQSGLNPITTYKYYMAQNAPMQSYYNAQLPPQQQQKAGLPPGHTIDYYTNQPIMNQAPQSIPIGYFYPYPGQYPSHNAIMPGGIMQSHYMQYDPRGNSPAYQAANAYGIPEGRCWEETHYRIVKDKPLRQTS